jgi:hypothetical protein
MKRSRKKDAFPENCQIFKIKGTVAGTATTDLGAVLPRTGHRNQKWPWPWLAHLPDAAQALWWPGWSGKHTGGFDLLVYAPTCGDRHA